VPLSDHEQRLLEQMERALYAEDPKFADALRKTNGANVDRKMVAIGAVGLIGGLCMLVGGMATGIEALGVIGFLGMLVGAFVMYRAFSGKGDEETGAPGDTKVPLKGRATATGPSQSDAGGFMDRMEERWKKRKEDERGDQY